MATKVELGKKLRALRLDAGMKATELSRDIFEGAITPNRISTLETGRCAINDRERDLYSKVFNIDKAELAIETRKGGWQAKGEYEISKLLEYYMKKRKAKTTDFVEAFGIDGARIRAIISGRSRARKDEAIMFARFFENQGATEKEFLNTKVEVKATNGVSKMKEEKVKMEEQTADTTNWRDKAFLLQKELNEYKKKYEGDFLNATVTASRAADLEKTVKELNDIVDDRNKVLAGQDNKIVTLEMELSDLKAQNDQLAEKVKEYKAAYYDTNKVLEETKKQLAEANVYKNALLSVLLDDYCKNHDIPFEIHRL